MSRVLITGGAGFIGFHLARRLRAAGWEIVSLDSLNPQVHADPELSRRRLAGSLIEGDVLAPASWSRIPRVDAIVHLAAETGVGQSMYEVDRYRSVNVEGTRAAARFAAERAVPLVFFSSRAVYGEGHWSCEGHGEHTGARCCDRATPMPSREEDAPAPVSVYGETKVAGERLLLDGEAGSVPVSIVRPQNVIGAGQALHNPYTGVLAAFLARLREGRPLQIYGDGSQTRDFVHVSDVTRLVQALLDSPSDPPRPLVVNCGTGRRTTLLDLAAFAIAGAPVDGTLEHVDVHRAGDIDHACADVSRLTAFGLPRAQVSVEEAVADFIAAGWEEPGAPSAAWDDALGELEDKGLTR